MLWCLFMNKPVYHHASCVGIDGKGLLLLGESGAGKSDLALRLIDGGATLIADDQVIIRLHGDRLMVSAPDTLRGLIEARGVGILRLPYLPEIPLTLAIHLVGPNKQERLPEAAFFHCFEKQVPLLSLHAFDPSVCAKIRLFLQALHS